MAVLAKVSPHLSASLRTSKGEMTSVVNLLECVLYD
jgi:hypothetical protein